MLTMFQPGILCIHTSRSFPRFFRNYTTANTPLLGKRVLITGGSRGIGLGIAKVFAGAGSSCVLIARDADRLLEAQKLLPSRTEVEHAVIAGDVGDASFWDDVRKKEKQKKTIDILVNAAGVTHYSLLLATNSRVIEDVVRTNLIGTIYGCRAVLKNMLRQKSGCIINISSVMGIKGGKGSAAYAASKAGILGLTRALADEVGRSSIRVNAIIPGFVTTDMTDKMTSGAMSQALEATPLSRLGTTEEIASAALFLATNGFANGSQIVVDGGLSSV